MSFLSAGELAQMRADQDRMMLDETCTILQATSSANAIGERVITWGTAGTNVPCRLAKPPTFAFSRSAAGQPVTQAPWTVTLPYGTAVNAGDRIVIDSVTYEVTQSWDEETHKTASRVDVMRLEVSA